MTYAPDPSLEDFVATIVRIGSAYDLEVIDIVYAEDQSVLVLDVDGSVARVSRAAMIEELRFRRDSGAESDAAEHRILHIEQQGSDAVVLLYRRAGADSRPVMSELRLRRYRQGWLVTGETVTPWPAAIADTRAALPERPAPAAVAHI